MRISSKSPGLIFAAQPAARTLSISLGAPFKSSIISSPFYPVCSLQLETENLLVAGREIDEPNNPCEIYKVSF
jgi:hypothetical protein